MIQLHPAESRFTANHGWLKTSFSFSFAEYYDPRNMNFGPLRVVNDDVVQPGEGFGMHPHKEMEIVSIVLKGQLQHEDSMGHKEVIRRGEVQRMTAGTGVVHSEVNPSDTDVVNLFQLWFLPDTPGLTPSYEQIAYDTEAMTNHLLPVVAKNPPSANVAKIHQDLTLYLSALEGGRSLTFEQPAGRRIYVMVFSGDLTLNGETLKDRDAARITDVERLEIASDNGASFMLIDLP
ncbi:MAG TPA: pirin family protein [Bacilli bacterium]|nr:pirin family protein [Bacilli bacterium]